MLKKCPCGNEWTIQPADTEDVPEVNATVSDSNPAPFVISWFIPFSLPRRPRLNPSQMPSAHLCNHRRLNEKREGRKV